MDRLLGSEATAIVAINRAFRGGEFGDQDWPNELIAFASDPVGDHFCIDTKSRSKTVFLRDHETLEILHESDNFEEWLETTEKYKD